MKCVMCGSDSDFPICSSCLDNIIDANSYLKIKPIKFDTLSNKILYKNRWVKPSKKIFESLVRTSLKIRSTSFHDKALIESIIRKNLRVASFEIRDSVQVQVSIFSKSFVVEVPVEKTLSQQSALSKSQYYVGILQVRNIRKSDVASVDLAVKESASKLDSFVTQRKVVKGGIDYYMTSMKALRSASSKLKSLFGADVSFNEKLFTRDSLRSKDVYKVNVLVKFFDFRKGDVVASDSKLVLLKSNKGTGLDLKTGRKIKLDLSREKLYKKEIYEGVVLNEHPLRIMDPKTFQSVEVANPKLFKSGSDKVEVVFHNNEWFLTGKEISKR